jgi:hypothetical protein
MAIMVSPLPGINNFLDSSNGRRTDVISIGALSISSINIQQPCETATVKTPGCHLNIPGVEVHI